MNEFVFELIKVAIMTAALLITSYIVPLVKEKIGSEKLAAVEKWVRYAVLKAQQVMESRTGQERKAYVLSFVRDLLEETDVTLSDAQIDILIEAAVKQMKMEEAAGILIDAMGETAEG